MTTDMFKEKPTAKKLKSEIFKKHCIQYQKNVLLDKCISGEELKTELKTIDARLDVDSINLIQRETSNELALKIIFTSKCSEEDIIENLFEFFASTHKNEIGQDWEELGNKYYYNFVGEKNITEFLKKYDVDLHEFYEDLKGVPYITSYSEFGSSKLPCALL